MYNNIKPEDDVQNNDIQLDFEDTSLMDIDTIIDEISSYNIKFCPKLLCVDRIYSADIANKYGKDISERIWFNNVIF